MTAKRAVKKRKTRTSEEGVERGVRMGGLVRPSGAWKAERAGDR
jgi:hypothetical protein